MEERCRDVLRFSLPVPSGGISRCLARPKRDPSPPQGLNVKLPLYQGYTPRQGEGYLCGTAQLFRSTDPEVRAYARQTLANVTEEEWQSQMVEADQWDENKPFKRVADGVLRVRGRLDLIRTWRDGDPINIGIRCSRCKSAGSERIECHPRFEVSSNKYVHMLQHCQVCPPQKQKLRHGYYYHHPVSGLPCGSIRTTSYIKNLCRPEVFRMRSDPELDTDLDD